MERHLVSAAVLLTVGWAVGRYRRAQERTVSLGQMASAGGSALAALRRAEEAERKAALTAQLRREIAERSLKS